MIDFLIFYWVFSAIVIFFMTLCDKDSKFPESLINLLICTVLGGIVFPIVLGLMLGKIRYN